MCIYLYSEFIKATFPSEMKSKSEFTELDEIPFTRNKANYQGEETHWSDI